MQAEDFCYWLQGHFELGGGSEGLSVAQVEIVKNHLALVFYHDIDPASGGDQQAQQEIHDGGLTQAPSNSIPGATVWHGVLRPGAVMRC